MGMRFGAKPRYFSIFDDVSWRLPSQLSLPFFPVLSFPFLAVLCFLLHLCTCKSCQTSTASPYLQGYKVECDLKVAVVSTDTLLRKAGSPDRCVPGFVCIDGCLCSGCVLFRIGTMDRAHHHTDFRFQRVLGTVPRMCSFGAYTRW